MNLLIIYGIQASGVKPLLAFAIHSQGENSDPLTVINAKTGSVVKTITLPSPWRTIDICTDKKGDVYVICYGNSTSETYVLKYSSNLDLVWSYTGTDLGTRPGGQYMSVNKNGELIVAKDISGTQGRLFKFNANGVIVTNAIILDPNAQRSAIALDLAIDGNNYIYLTRYQSYNDNRLLAKFDKDTFACIWETSDGKTKFPSSYAPFVQKVLVDKDGYIYITSKDYYQDFIAIAKFNANGIQQSPICSFSGIVAAPLICDNSKLYCYYTSGTNKYLVAYALSDLSQVVQRDYSSYNRITDMTIASDGTLLAITESSKPEIYRIDPTTLNVIETFTKSKLDRIKLQGGTIGVYQSNW